jgi:hypothetical protein
LHERSLYLSKYLVEVFVPRSQAQEAQATGNRARAAAEQLGRENVAVRHVRTTYLPDDETCFHVFEAASKEIVREVCWQAGLRWPRIIRVVE